MDSASLSTLRGDGFVLEPLSEDHAELFVEASRTDVPDWTFVPRDLDRPGALAWIARGVEARHAGRAVRLAIEVDGQHAGTVGAQHPYAHDPGIVETFYFVLPAFRRRGLASAALRVLQAWLVDTIPELRRLQLHVVPGNPGSERVAERSGYQREGVLKNQIRPVNGFGPRSAIAYGLEVTARASGAGQGVLA